PTNKKYTRRTVIMPFSRISCVMILIATSLMAETPSPVVLKVPPDVSNVTLPGYTEYALTSLNFQTAAMVDVTALSKSAQNAARNQMQTSAVYAGVSQNNPQLTVTPGPAQFGPPPAVANFDFKKTGDAAQAWATMQSNGMPFVELKAIGHSVATGAVMWKAK